MVGGLGVAYSSTPFCHKVCFARVETKKETSDWGVFVLFPPREL